MPTTVQASRVSLCGPYCYHGLLGRKKHHVRSAFLPSWFWPEAPPRRDQPTESSPQTPRASSHWQQCLGWHVRAELPGSRMTAGVTTMILAPIKGGFSMFGVGESCPSDPFFFFAPTTTFQKGRCTLFSPSPASGNFRSQLFRDHLKSGSSTEDDLSLQLGDEPRPGAVFF